MCVICILQGDREAVEITTTTTKNALLTSQIRACESAANRNKISIIKAGKVGVACAIAILMKVRERYRYTAVASTFHIIN